MTPPLGLTLPCTVLKAHDGDSITVEVRVVANVRLTKCWAPELSQPGGIESRDNLARAVLGMKGRLLVPMDDDVGNLAAMFTFGRVLGDVWVDGDSESVAAMQVRTGHASTRKGGLIGE